MIANITPAATAPRRLLTVGQVAELLGVDKRTVWRWDAQRILPAAYRYGRRIVRWDAEAIEAWLAEHRAAAARPA